MRKSNNGMTTLKMVPFVRLWLKTKWGSVLMKENLTIVFLVIWCILVLAYFTVWQNNWFILISTNMLLLVKLYLDYKHNKK